MVVEDYPPFLISEIYLQDVGLLSYPHHRPLERVNWVFPFWADARGQDALLGLPLFWGPVDGPANGAYFQTPSIINGLKGLGKRVSEQDKLSKILRCLPLKWNFKTKAIEEAKNLKELPLKELIGFLMTYEMKIARQEKEMQEEEGKNKSIALKAQENKVVDETKNQQHGR